MNFVKIEYFLEKIADCFEALISMIVFITTTIVVSAIFIGIASCDQESIVTDKFEEIVKDFDEVEKVELFKFKDSEYLKISNSDKIKIYPVRDHIIFDRVKERLEKLYGI